MGHTGYPRWLYHKSLPAVIVRDPEQEEALGDGWHESPADVNGEVVEATEEVSEVTDGTEMYASNPDSPIPSKPERVKKPKTPSIPRKPKAV